MSEGQSEINREREMPRHCDSYIHDFEQPMCLRWWLFVHRIPASDKILCEKNGVNPTLFATFKPRPDRAHPKVVGTRVRVTMASRLGDVGITANFEREMGYEYRVPVEDLTDFSATA